MCACTRCEIEWVEGNAVAPVLKHGPRSKLSQRVGSVELAEFDPKDSELCLAGVKPVETRVEALCGSDVQIDRLSWV